MKKKISLLMLCVLVMVSSLNAFAAEENNNNNQNYYTFSEYNTEVAIPTSRMERSTGSSLVWGYGLTGTAGWVAGHNITATSSAELDGQPKIIDKMTTKLTFNFSDGSTRSNDKSGSTSSQSLNMYDAAGNTEIESYVSNHTFKHTGYVTTTKTIRKTPTTI